MLRIKSKHFFFFVISVGEEGNGTTEQTKVPRKRRWGASKSIRPTKKPLVSISTHSLKVIVSNELFYIIYY